MKIAAAYIRVSTDGQLEYIPDSQLKVVRDYAQKNGMLLPESFIFQEEEGISGKQAEKRPAFMRMIGMAKQKPKPFDCILLWKFSRFARSRRDSIVYKTMLRKQLGIDVISVTEQLGDDKLSLLLEAVIEAMDEYYSINLAEEVKRGMLEKVSRGEPVTPPAYGYRIQEKRYIPNSETAPVVRWMFEQRAQGISCKEIAQQLNEMGIPTARGLRWEARAVEYLLQNPVYIGKIRWNPHRSSGRQETQQPSMLTEGNHKPLVDLALWAEVQNQQNRRIRRERQCLPKRCYPLRGLVFCSSCGAPLVKSARNALQCCGYAHGNCTISHYIPNQRLEEWIYCTLDADLSLQNLQMAPIPHVNPESLLHLQVEREKKKLERLRDAYEAGAETLEDYCREKARLQARLTTLTADMKRLSFPSVAHKPINISSLLRSNQITGQEKNRLLHTIFKRIVFDSTKNHLDCYYQTI